MKFVNMAEADQEKFTNTNVKQHDWIVDLIKQEIAKALKGTQINREGSSNSSVIFIHTIEYAGTLSFPFAKPESHNSWIIDT